MIIRDAPEKTIAAPRRPVHWPSLLGTLLAALLLRGGLLWAQVIPFNADEAVVGLMARHILQGERPIFFYGQAYMGSLDAWLVAGFFSLLGPSVLAIRLAQTLLYLGLIATTYLLALEIYNQRWIAGTAALFIALPTVLVTLYTTASLGGYGEALLIGNVLFLLALKMGRAPAGGLTWAGWGLLAGGGLWSFPLVLVYLVPAIVFLLVRRQRSARRWLLAGLGFAVGAAPWGWYTLTHGLSTLSEMGGSAIAGVSGLPLLLDLVQHFYNYLLFSWTVLFGLRPPWSAEFLALPLSPLAITVYAALVVFSVRRTAQLRDAAQPGRWLLLGGILTTSLFFIFTPFGADPSGRYFLPMAAPFAIFLGEMLEPRRLGLRRGAPPWFSRSLALGLLTFNLWGTVQCAAKFPPGLTTQFGPETHVDWRALPELTDFLQTQGETYGYTNYWLEFPLAFLSDETLIYEARLPYHLDFRYTPRDNRYAPYTQRVAASPRVAYLLARHEPLAARLRLRLAAAEVTFAEKTIGDFTVFYALSRKVTPADLNLLSEEP